MVSGVPGLVRHSQDARARTHFFTVDFDCGYGPMIVRTISTKRGEEGDDLSWASIFPHHQIQTPHSGEMSPKKWDPVSQEISSEISAEKNPQ